MNRVDHRVLVVVGPEHPGTRISELAEIARRSPGVDVTRIDAIDEMGPYPNPKDLEVATMPTKEETGVQPRFIKDAGTWRVATLSEALAGRGVPWEKLSNAAQRRIRKRGVAAMKKAIAEHAR